MSNFNPGDKIRLDEFQLSPTNKNHPAIAQVMRNGGTIKRNIGLSENYYLEEVSETYGSWPGNWFILGSPKDPPKICGSIYG